jgi:hypothetical protein
MEHTPEAHELDQAGADDPWGLPLTAVVCERCNWRYLMPEPVGGCPYCYHPQLTRINQPESHLPYAHPPELVLPFTITDQHLEFSVERFLKGVPFAPGDLNPGALKGRMQRIYLPMWLVDADITADWQGEIGFDYQVVSHQDRYEQNRGGWTSHQMEETRVRWEPRLGRLKRTYHNVDASALERGNGIDALIAMYELSKASEYDAKLLADALVRLPDREPDDAWESARPAFQSMAAEECRQAAGGDHVRRFTWKPEYANQHWTLLLLPLYNSYYLGDKNEPQRVLINGQTGQLIGKRLGSMERARKTSFLVLAVALVLFLISVIVSIASVFLPVLLAIGVLGLAGSLIGGLGAIFPVATVWWFNRQQS